MAALEERRSAGGDGGAVSMAGAGLGGSLYVVFGTMTVDLATTYVEEAFGGVADLPGSGGDAGQAGSGGAAGTAGPAGPGGTGGLGTINQWHSGLSRRGGHRRQHLALTEPPRVKEFKVPTAARTRHRTELVWQYNC